MLAKADKELNLWCISAPAKGSFHISDLVPLIFSMPVFWKRYEMNTFRNNIKKRAPKGRRLFSLVDGDGGSSGISIASF